MVRFLSLLILSLNTWSDVRHRITLSITAAVLIGLASFVVISMVVTDASSPLSWVRHEQKGKAAVAVRPGATSRKLSSNFGSTSSRLVGRRAEPPLQVSAAKGGTSDSSTKVMNGQQTFVAQPGSATVPPASTSAGSIGSTTSNTSSNSQMPPVSVRLASAQLVCQQGQEVFVMPSADLKFQSPLNSDGVLVWQWEARFDTGGDVSGVQPLSDTNSHEQSVVAGATDVSLSGAQPSPLLSAPESSDYGYSFRLHITSPLDSVSDWVSVPQAVSTC